MKTKKIIALFIALMIGVYVSGQVHSSIAPRPDQHQLDYQKLMWLMEYGTNPFNIMLIPMPIAEQKEIVKQYVNYYNGQSNASNTGFVDARRPVCKSCPNRTIEPSPRPRPPIHQPWVTFEKQDLGSKSIR